MKKRYAKPILYSIGIVLALVIIIYTRTVLLLGFAGVLVAILLHAIGHGTKWLTHLPYALALTLALALILFLIALVFWLYSEKIADQFEMLITQLPQAYETVHNYISRYVGNILPQQKLQQELFNKQNLTQLFSVFSTTLGAIGSLVVVLFIGFYLAFNPTIYMKWILALVPLKRQNRVRGSLEKIAKSLRWWVLGKCLSMCVIGIATFIGLSQLGISLALILGFLAGILAFIPYVGAIIASIPAVLIAFAQSPLQAVYVSALFAAIHTADGYFITPFIEQRTVYVPPAISVMAQMILVLLTGFVGLALATPLVVVAVSLIKQALHRDHPSARSSTSAESKKSIQEFPQ